MDIVLDETEARILGSLIEKEMTTPEYYPLSLNALVNACSQKSNRYPVVSYDELTAENGLRSLQQKGLARMTHTAGSRVPKYLHTILDRFDLSGQELAVICELLLRGPQTTGELRSRAERMAPLKDLEETERVLQALMEQSPPLVAKLPREAGRKESRYMHLLSGKPVSGETAYGSKTEESQLRQPSGNERISSLEDEVKRLRDELEELKKAFAEFRSQF